MEQNENNTLPTPAEIYEYLNERVIGQDDAKKVLALGVYNHYKRLLMYDPNSVFSSNVASMTGTDYDDVTIDKSNILLLGSTGTGKTYMIKQIAKLLGVPCYIADMTKVTESGYVGDDVESILSGLLMECDYNVPVAECGIVVCDEIDKICRRTAGQSLTRDVGGEGVQQSLLKIIEGSVVNVPPMGGRKHPEQPGIKVNTSNILFIGLGAFPDLDKIIERRVKPNSGVGYAISDPSKKQYNEDYNYYRDVTHEDIKEFGFIPEFLGRFPVLTYTNPLTEDDLVRILTEPKNSIIDQYSKLMAADNVRLKFEDNALVAVAKAASEHKTGARALRGILEKVLFDIMFRHGLCKEQIEITVTEQDVNKLLN